MLSTQEIISKIQLNSTWHFIQCEKILFSKQQQEWGNVIAYSQANIR